MAAQVINIRTRDKVDTITVREMPPVIRQRVEFIQSQLTNARESMAKQRLRIGSLLVKLQSVLSPMGMFTPYLASLPWMPPANAYRYIKTYEHTAPMYSPTMLSKIMVSGLPIFWWSDEQPYGRYTEAVAKVGEPPTNGNDNDENKWLADVQATYKRTRKGRTRLTAGQVMERAASAIERTYAQSPVSISRQRFAQQVIDLFLSQGKRKAA